MAELSEQILMKRDGGVGRGMGSNGRKGSHSPWQLVRSFQLADGFPDPWPVFVARQFKRARTVSVGAPVRPATAPPAVRAPSQSVRQDPAAGPRRAPICPSNWSASS